MFDPFSALASLSFATGTLGFLATTLSKIDERATEMRECKDRLRSYCWQLRDIQLKLAAWRWIWFGNKPFSDDTYIFFWGKEEYDTVQRRIEDVMVLCQDIETILRRLPAEETRQPLSSADFFSMWSQHTDHRRHDPLNIREVSLFTRIAFTLFYNAELQEKLARLKLQIEGLEGMTQHVFRLRQGSDDGKVRRSELQNLSDLKDFRENTAEIGNNLYNHMTRFPVGSAIDLSPFESSSYVKEWEDINIFSIYLMLRFQIGSCLKLKRIRLFGDITAKVTLRPVEPTAANIWRVFQTAELKPQDVFAPLNWSCIILQDPAYRSRTLRQMLLDGVF
ncbi:hypothetical protein MMC28_011395, partial [Mycoblastus sanguinarius]|nr:hypothetical protein [Mycoblastus sanguinarius]